MHTQEHSSKESYPSKQTKASQCHLAEWTESLLQFFRFILHTATLATDWPLPTYMDPCLGMKSGHLRRDFVRNSRPKFSQTYREFLGSLPGVLADPSGLGPRVCSLVALARCRVRGYVSSCPGLTSAIVNIHPFSLPSHV